MRLKKVVGIGIILLSILTIFTVVSLNSQNNRLNDEQKIILQQFNLENGVIPVEIKNPQAVFKSPTSVEKINFAVKNNTNKSIKALCLVYSIRLEKDNVASRDRFFHTVETFVHKDISETGSLKPIAPGQETIIQENGETSYEGGSIIKGIEAKIDYVEFDDGTVLGANEKGEKLILFIRDGASKYKDWLIQQYIENKKSISVTVSLIQKDEIPKELGFVSQQQKLGAKIYRRHLRKLYETRGNSGLTEFFDKSELSQKVK